MNATRSIYKQIYKTYRTVGTCEFGWLDGSLYEAAKCGYNSYCARRHEFEGIVNMRRPLQTRRYLSGLAFLQAAEQRAKNS